MTNLNLCCETGTDRNGLYPALTYAAFDSKTCAVTGLADRNASPISVTVPAYAPDGLRVVAVADKAFSGCQSLRVVSLPETVESVGRRAYLPSAPPCPICDSVGTAGCPASATAPLSVASA